MNINMAIYTVSLWLTETQLELLVGYRCAFNQGFFIALPYWKICSDKAKNRPINFYPIEINFNIAR
jgi:hypothetical protein